jgi:hypothetical protein
VEPVDADEDVALLRRSPFEVDAHAAVEPLEAGAGSIETHRLRRQRAEKRLLEVRAVHAEHLPAALRVGDLDEHPPAPVEPERFGRRVPAAAELVGDAKPLERGHGVRGQRDSGADRRQRLRLLEHERIVPRLPHCDGSGEPADPATDYEDAHYETVSLKTSGRW